MLGSTHLCSIWAGLTNLNTNLAFAVRELAVKYCTLECINLFYMTQIMLKNVLQNMTLWHKATPTSIEMSDLN